VDPDAFLIDLRKPLVDCVRANEGYRVLSLLFKILDQGPTYLHQSVLKILFGLLSGLDLAEQNVRTNLASWVSIVARFVTGQIWKDASMVLESVLKAFPSPTHLDAGAGLRSQAVSHAPTKPGFTNKPGGGVDHTLTELMKVLATTMAAPPSTSTSKAKKSPSATYEVFEKFFSFNDAALASKAVQGGAGGEGEGARQPEGGKDAEKMFGMYPPRRVSVDEGDQDSVRVFTFLLVPFGYRLILFSFRACRT
jgi:hypothetical protein